MKSLGMLAKRIFSKVGLLLFLCLLGVNGCGNHEDGNKKIAPRTITDMMGRTVSIPLEVRRVASNGGAIDEWFLLLGARKKMVSTSPAIKANPWFVKIYPGVVNLPAAFHNSDVNIEELVKAKPDVVLVLAGIAAQEKLTRAGIPLVILERRNHEELKQGITLAGKILGPREERVAADFCAYYDANIRRVTVRTSVIPRLKRLKVYMGGGVDGLSTEGKRSLVTSWIETAGGINVAAESGIDGIGKRVSLEELIQWNPDVIIVSDINAKANILKSGQWKDINAVRHNRVYVNPRGAYLWSVRSAEEALQVLWAAKTLYPDLFADMNMSEEVKKFHKTFYGYDLTDDDAARMLAALPPRRQL
jgi:iron complex transport system substrate-binding protein